MAQRFLPILTKLRIPKVKLVSRRMSSSSTVRATISKNKEREIKQCLITLQLDSDDIDKHSGDTVKHAFLKLAKQYHPDSSSLTSDRENFEAASAAYNTLTEFYKSYTPANEHVEVEEMDGEPRVAPQHRRYLEFEGVGYGSPSQRKSQYDKWRADRASEQVFQYRHDAMLRNDADTAVVKQEKENKYTRRIKTSNLLLRMADDMIKESMANGDFENLPGTGKPLKSLSDHNPYVDAHTHKLNSVLINNGYAPEWMNLENEIKNTYRKLKSELQESYEKYYKTSPKTWNRQASQFKSDVESLNKQIDRLNMIVPSLRLQMAHYNAEVALKKLKS